MGYCGSTRASSSVSTMKYNTDRILQAVVSGETSSRRFRVSSATGSTRVGDEHDDERRATAVQNAPSRCGLVKDPVWSPKMHKTSGNSIEFIAAADALAAKIKDPKGKALPINAIGAQM